ncbi:MAG: CoA transferase subunit A [Actinobacteria bacterium]|nr:CoA transferase subunit A [Actinomycetota bacterium]
MKKLITIEEALKKVKDGQVVMIGGFMSCGTPETIIDAMVKKRVKDLVVIANDTAIPGKGIGKLISNRQIKKIFASHIGLNRETGEQINEGNIEAEFIPQGTLAERIRSAGTGLGGILTPIGIGTIVEKNKKIIKTNGKKFILEMPLKADISLIKAFKADMYGNLIYKKSERNFNPIMAMASEYVIAEVEEFLDNEYIDPEVVITPGLFIDAIVLGGYNG